ncbi:MAG: hypothetical protein AB7H88_22290 [Vicinamibacterales bacterium]
MSDDAPKSALELAMERLRKKDAADGVSEQPLTGEQKEAIAEIRRVYAAKLANEEILHRSKAGAPLPPEERLAVEQAYRREVERLEGERDRKIDKARHGA